MRNISFKQGNVREQNADLAKNTPSPVIWKIICKVFKLSFVEAVNEYSE